MADVISKKSIGAALALKLIQAAEKKAAELGKAMVICITDESGVQKAFLRMDGAPQVSVEIAFQKAKTAIGFGIPTHAWHEFIKNDPPLALGAPNIKDLVIYGGGYPVKSGDAVIGGIGVSGGHYTDDMKVAEAALAVLP